MAIRPPKAPRVARNSARLRETTTVALTALALVLFSLRALLALMDIRTWTVAWQVVSAPTSFVILPLQQWSAMESTLGGRLTVAESLAVLVVAAASAVILSSLANKRLSQRPPT